MSFFVAFVLFYLKNPWQSSCSPLKKEERERERWENGQTTMSVGAKSPNTNISNQKTTMPKEEKDIRVIAWTTSKLLETAFPIL